MMDADVTTDEVGQLTDEIVKLIRERAERRATAEGRSVEPGDLIVGMSALVKANAWVMGFFLPGASKLTLLRWKQYLRSQMKAVEVTIRSRRT